MKYIFSLILLHTTMFLLQAQGSINFEFTGALVLPDNQSITYKIVVNEINNEKISGYTITDFDGTNQTKSLISGTWNRKKDLLTFEEMNNLSTKSEVDESSFCFIKIDAIKIRTIVPNSVLQGKFKGELPSGKLCAEGTLTAASKNYHSAKKQILKSVIKKVEAKELISTVGNPNDSILTANEKILINNWGDSVAIQIWDGNIQDNDIIDIYIDGKLFKDHILLQQKMQTIVLPSTQQKFTVKIVAGYEGFSGKNTVNFRMKNTSDTNDYVSDLSKGEFFEIDFIKTN